MWNLTGARGLLGVGPELLKLGPLPATSQLPVPGTSEGTESLLHTAIAMELCMRACVHLCVFVHMCAHAHVCAGVLRSHSL